jgi:type I restriction enzyme S subunit
MKSENLNLITIADLVKEGAIVEIQDGNHGEKHPKTSDYVDDGVPFIMANNIAGNRVDIDGAQKIPLVLADSLRIGFAKTGDVLLTHKGTIGSTAIVDTTLPYLMLTPQVTYYRTNPEKLRNRYLMYAFREELFQKTIISLAQQATRPYIGITAQRRLKIRWKPIDQQDRVVEILSAYDDLIENNRRRIQLLEQAVRLLYKEWFVHLRFPGHEHTQIINGVPEGWEKGVVSDFYDTASGGTPSRKNPEFYGGTIRWVKTQELEDGFLFDTEEHITENAIKKSAAKLFPANAVLIAMYGATIGQVGVIVESSTCNQACCAVMPKAEGTSYEHAFLFFLNNKEGLRNLGQGAAQKNISQQVIRAYEMVLPDKLVLNMFRINAGPFLRQIRTLHAMNQKLTKARDILLPKLMNGEVAV